MLLALAVLVGLALVAAPIVRLSPRAGTLVVAAIPAAVGGWFASHLPRVASGETLLETYAWLPELGVELGFRLDGLSLTFALLINIVGALVLLYSSDYLRGDRRLGGFTTTLLGFMASMLGLVLADNLILLFVFWELTSITSFLLIGFDHQREQARKSALQALLVTGLGGLALLAGVVLLGLTADGFSLGAVLSADLRDHPRYAPIAVLLLLGACTKSAIFPFHFWLPNAMEAPSPVSALLHSATMVKAGVYLVARLHPSLGGTLLWDETLTIAGGFTMLSAAFLATRQDQLKRILAYSTVSSLGTLMMLIGMGSPKAAATYLIAHALFKGCLFLVAGSVTKQTGLKDPAKLGGLWRTMPLLTAAAVAGALSMAGMFPLIGFVGKELLLKSGLAHPEWAPAVTVATATAGALTVMAALLVGFRPFLGKPPRDAPSGNDPSWRQALGPVVLAATGLLAGLAPALFAEPLVASLAASIRGAPLDEPIQLGWLGYLYPPSVATTLSVLALIVGLVLYLLRAPYRRAGVLADQLHRVGPARGYDLALRGLMALASFQTRLLQHGSLQGYVRVTLLTIIAAASAAIARTSIPQTLSPDLADATPLDLALALILALSAIAATLQRSALASVALIGGVGFTIALIFGLYGAPDVAMTQFAIETLIVIIFVLVIFHLPRYSTLTRTPRRLLDALVAGVFGLVASVLALAVSQRVPPDSVSAFHAERAVPEGFGRNVVNVILVDFRALDTLGEVYVIGIAAIGVYTLLRLRTSAIVRKGAGP